MDLRERMSIDLIAVDHPAVVAPALATGPTAYDASYKWPARQLEAGR